MKSNSKILVLGSGGREHALVWHLHRMGHEVEAAPGSDAISELCKTWNFDSFEDLARKIKESEITEVIVGPEKYLAEGISDFLTERGISVFGPTRAAAQLETSKSFAKDFCKRFKIPTAEFQNLNSEADLKEAISNFRPPYVVKASGLAAGKGVWIGQDPDQAFEIGKNFLLEHESLVLEEFLEGKELSVFYLVDGSKFSFLGAACDHKRLKDNDEGPNTGGMGAYCPPSFWNSSLQTKIEEEILRPSLDGLKQEKTYYRGFIFLGLMFTNDNQIYLIEYNCRMGDPETQSLVPRFESSLVDAIASLKSSSTNSMKISAKVGLSVVLSTPSYPRSSAEEIPLPELTESPADDLIFFHSGTFKKNNQFHGKGGRVFSAATTAKTLDECQDKIYTWILSSKLENKLHFRRDIGVQGNRHG